VLVYNVTQQDIAPVKTFDDLRAFRRERGDNILTVAPHPYYPHRHSLLRQFERNIDVFDAIEHAQVHLTWLNFNKPALEAADEHGKPVIANSDAHNLWMFGRHYTMVDAAPTIPAIFQAIREHRVRFHSPPVTLWECFKFVVFDELLHRKPGRIVNSFED
jgi:predicted metal-dependent phosphoesterase TrpH